MAATDFIIVMFGGGTFLNAELKELQARTGAVVWFIDSVPKNPNSRTGAWADFIHSKGGSVIGMWNNAPNKPAGATLGRVAVIAFSEGGQGLKTLLTGPDASKIDTVIAIDAIHCNYIGQTKVSDPPPRVRAINPADLWMVIAFAKLAADPSTQKCMVVTHSSVRPNFASTTETANVIWSQGTANAQRGPSVFPDLRADSLANVNFPSADYPLGTKLAGGEITQAGYCTVRPKIEATNFMPTATFCWPSFADGWYARNVMNGLNVFGWGYGAKTSTKDPSGNRDHVFQAQIVLPVVAREYLLRRWAPVCATQGFGDAASCPTPEGQGYNDGPPPAPLENPFLLGTVTVPEPAKTCPAPMPGKFIVGRPGEPCWTPEPVEELPTEEETSGTKVALGLVGVGLGIAVYYYGHKWVTRSR